jgi:hypothetical protein
MASINDNEPSSCGPDCSCNPKKGLSIQVKVILLAIIIVGAGAVLTASLIKKSQTAASAKPSTGYAVSIPQTPLTASMFKNDVSGSGADDSQAVSFTPLASISALNDVAQDVDGVFILMVKNEADKTTAIVKEVTAAKKAIATRGIRMAAFQLSSNAPEFSVFSSQLPPPGIVVIVKGKSMRGVQGADINKTKLLQAFIAASQASSCCSSGGNHVCK